MPDFGINSCNLEEEKNLGANIFRNMIIYFMAHRSMMEMEHSDWILSGPYFAVWTAHITSLFCFELICLKLCYFV